MIDPGKTLAVGLLAVCVNAILSAVKIGVGLIGNSYALVADGIESVGDILSSLITWAGFQLSLRPADDDHPFGHGKLEPLAGLFSGAALLTAAVVIGWNAILEIRSPQHAPAWFTLPVLLAVIVVKTLLAKTIQRLSGDLDSRALEGDAWHHRADAVTSAAVGLGITVALIGGPGWEAADDYAALLACAVIVLSGVKIAKNSLHEVLDGSVQESLIEDIRRIAQEEPGVLSIEKCRARKSGIGFFVEVHVRVDGGTTVREGHSIGHLVKDRLKNASLRIIDATVHLEPEHT